jgi:rRNA maturation RNase YbeY
MIQFQTQDITFKLKHKTPLKQWIVEAIAKQKKYVGEINYIFCSDDYLLEINKKYLQHDTLTDIITFDYTADTGGAKISGDIFISIDRVKENAEKFAVIFETELHRVMIHGVLHLLGYKDKNKTDKAAMRKAEDFWLKKL